MSVIYHMGEFFAVKQWVMWLTISALRNLYWLECTCYFHNYHVELIFTLSIGQK